MQDRVELPESLERAFEQLKTTPTDFELAKERAAAWEQVRQTGRRRLFWSKWNHLLTGVVGLAVVALAIFIPVRMEGFLSSGQPLPPETKVPSVQSGDQDDWKQRETKYKSLGFTMFYRSPERNVELIYNAEAVFVVQDGEWTQLFAFTPDEQISFYGERDDSIALLVKNVTKQRANVEDRLYLLDFNTLQVQKLATTGEILVQREGDMRTDKVIFAQLDHSTLTQQIVAAEWKSGKLDVLLETKERYYNQLVMEDEYVVISNGYQILLKQGDKEWVTLAESKNGTAKVVRAEQGVLHFLADFVRDEPNKKMTGWQHTFYQYRLRTYELIPIMAAGSETRIIMTETPGPYEYLVSTWGENEPYEPTTSSKMRYGRLQLWQVGADGKTSQKIWDRPDVSYMDRVPMITGPETYPTRVLKLIPGPESNWSLSVDLESGVVKEETNVKQN